MKKIVFAGICILTLACTSKKQKADLIVFNAVVYTVDSVLSVKEAIAVKDGKILDVGTSEYIVSNYEYLEKLDAAGQTIFPGFIDAHCHFYGYGKGLQEVDLVGTSSFGEVIKRVVQFTAGNSENAEKTIEHHGSAWIIGRGWDQNDWKEKEFPDRAELDSLFPDQPVLLTRIDGHAALVNKAALSLAGFTVATKINGGELIVKDGKLTGILVDNAVDSIQKLIPPPSFGDIKKALLAAQKNCLEVGLTTIDDAGLTKNIVDAIDKLQKDGELNMRIYAMLTLSEENLNYFLKKGIYKTDRLNIRSFKFYGDGALGSRGACLRKEYSDKPGWKGFLLEDISYFDSSAARMADKGFQMNTHCIGDSAAKVILTIYSKYLKDKKDPRWRIEHAQILDPVLFPFFSDKILPSVQPTHATSDMYWAGDRLGSARLIYAYAYKKLLKASGIVALGTDFPVEDISPFKTFYAAVVRKDANGFPAQGFQMENALTREEALKGMTIWAAYSNFEEHEKGSIEKGKFADFVILDTDLMKCKEDQILKAKVKATYINGIKLYSSD